MFIFCGLLVLFVPLVRTFVATLVVCPLIWNICTRGLFLGVRKCSNNSCFVFELFLGALEVRDCFVCFKFFLSFDQGELLLSRTVETDR